LIQYCFQDSKIPKLINMIIIMKTMIFFNPTERNRIDSKMIFWKKRIKKN